MWRRISKDVKAWHHLRQQSVTRDIREPTDASFPELILGKSLRATDDAEFHIRARLPYRGVCIEQYLTPLLFKIPGDEANPPRMSPHRRSYRTRKHDRYDRNPVRRH